MIKFAPDLFSDSTPKWAEGSGTNLEDINELIPSYFRGQSLDSMPLRAGSFELNSSNFKFSICGKAFVGKKWPAITPPEKVESQLQLLHYLASESLPVPPPVRSLTGRFSVSSRGHLWGIFEFVHGSYFRGSLPELESTGQAIGRLLNFLGNFNGGEFFPPPQLADSSTSDLIFSSLSRRKGLTDSLGIQGAEILSSSLSRVLEGWKRTRRNKIDTARQLVHYDIHPHNLLMTEAGQPAAVLDFDSCAMLSPEVGVGFACLKLGRQAVNFLGHRDYASKVTDIFISQIAREYEREIDLSLVKIAAEGEVMRRISLILFSAFESNDQSWTHVLPVQIGHLHELDAMFG